MSVVTENNELEQQEEKIKKIDFKMVTFSLAERDYAVDIMKVKEIAKALQFTLIPNAPHYVRGVYNLRGEIIPVIDLRKMFHLNIKKEKDGKLENVIILRLEGFMLGVIVDRINKVVGIDSETIKEPHPLLDDINIKYIDGIVDHDNKLYILLDVDRIFGEEEIYPEEKEMKIVSVPEAQRTPKIKKISGEINFIIETLSTFKSFHVTALNREWVEKRFLEWADLRKEQGVSIQFSGEKDAEEFLRPFYSPYTSRLWGQDLWHDMLNLLPDNSSSIIKVWNPGCGSGYETYAFATVLRERYAEKQIKVWANDNDLLSVSMAPNLIFSEISGDDKFYVDKGFMEKVKAGYQFIQKILDSILFDYHNILHRNEIKDVDIILARDILSFLTPEDQKKILSEFQESIKDTGLLILGKNEHIFSTEWVGEGEGKILAYRKENV